MIDVRCPCGLTFHAEESQIGKKLSCWKCGTVVPIEKPTPAPISMREPVVVDVRPAANARKVVERATGFRAKVWSPRIGAAFGVFLAVAVALWVASLTIFSTHHDLPHKGPAIKSPAAAAGTWVQPKSQVPSRSTGPTGREGTDASHRQRERSSSGEASAGLRALAVTKLPRLEASASARVLIPPCAVGQQSYEPLTGELLGRTADGYGSGRCRLTVINGTSGDAAVRLADYLTGATARFFYIRARDTYTVIGVDGGFYSLMFEAGSDWIPACRGFLRGENAQEFDKPLSFEVTWFDWGYKVSHLTVTLNPVPHGTVKTHAIDRRRFFQGDQNVALGP